MKIELDPAETPFNIDYTLSCGQTFRWQKQDNWWTGVIQGTVVKTKQTENGLEFVTSSNKVNADFLKCYFRLADDLPNVYSEIAKDKHMFEAIEQFRGLRLVRQSPWECLISFICATYKNVPAIKQMIFNISREFGEPIEFKGETYYAFPSPRALAEANPQRLRNCKLGFRAEHVLKASKMINSGRFDLESLRTRPYDIAKKELMMLPGVGHKVADCVLLFSLDKLEAFPIDVWMKRIILRYYDAHFEDQFLDKVKFKNSLTPHEYQLVYDFGRRYFGSYVGYAQEYLYHYERCLAGASPSTVRL
jgi:N-glycosylase/DNA lyase